MNTANPLPDAGKVAMITGSTAGIGCEIGRQLAARGATVCFNGRSPGAIEGLLDEIRAMGARAFFYPADVWDYEAVAAMAEQVRTEAGPVDYLVVSGGSLEKVPGQYFMEIDPKKYVEYANGQWLSRMYVFRAFAPQLMEKEQGRVVFLGTDAGRIPTPGVSLPGGAGAALVMCTKVLAQEFARHGTRINTVSTTVTQGTPGLEKVLAKRAAARVFEKAVRKQPFPVMADDVARTVLHLLSPAADGITGQTISINGGLSYPG